MSSLTFKRLQVGPFQGIDTDKPLVIEFPKTSSKSKRRPIGKLSGDERLGKSSFIHFLCYATAQTFGIKDENLVNIDKNAMNGEIEFEKNGETWKVVFTKTTFKLFRFFQVGKESDWIPQGQVEKQLKALIGNVAISPMKLKVDDGKKQVDWLFKMLNIPTEVLTKAAALTTRINNFKTARAQANKEYEFIKKTLSEDPMYINWKDSEKKFKEKKTLDSVQKKVHTLTAKKIQYSEGQEKHAAFVRKIGEKTTDIAEIKAKLEQAERELVLLEKSKTVADEWLKNNETIQKQYEDAHKEFETISQYQADQKAWERLQEQKTEMDEYETLVQDGDKGKDRLLKERRDLLANALPSIEGLEVYTDNEIDGPKAGIYLGGKNPMQLSESELFDLYFKICRQQGVTMVLVENITDFGTDVIRTLNEMARAGVYVWATEMRRGQKKLKIEFLNKLI